MLHCPAVLYVAPPAEVVDAALTETGRAQVEAVAHALAGERVAAVYASRMPSATATAALAAELLQTDLHPLPGLAAEMPTSDPSTDPEAREALQSVADLHRGETVLVVGAGPRRVVEIGDDGWWLRPWPEPTTAG